MENTEIKATNSKTTLKKVWDVVSTVLVGIVVLIALFLMGSRVIGFRVFTVISGSMEPEYSVGDLIYVKEIDPKEVEVGDDITFVVNQDLVVATHRVIAVDREKGEFRTQGLANDTPDAKPVEFENVIGTPVFAIPYLGYVSDWIQNPPGIYITIAFGVLFAVLLFLPDIIKPKKAEAAEPVESDELKAMREELEKTRRELESARAAVKEVQEAGGEETPEDASESAGE